MTQDSPKAYTIQDAADLAGVSKEVIRAHIKRGNLTARYPSTRPVILAAELDEWLTNLPTDA